MYVAVGRVMLEGVVDPRWYRRSRGPVSVEENVNTAVSSARCRGGSGRAGLGE